MMDSLKNIVDKRLPIFIGAATKENALQIALATINQQKQIEIKQLIEIEQATLSSAEGKQWHEYTNANSWICVALPAKDVVVQRQKSISLFSKEKKYENNAIEHLFPLSLSQAIFRNIGTDHIVAAKREDVQNCEEKFEDLQLHADTITCEPLAIVKLWHYIKNKTQEVVYWIYLGPTYTCCVAAEKDTLLFCSTIMQGIHSVKEASDQSMLWSKEVAYLLATWQHLSCNAQPLIYLIGSEMYNSSLQETLQSALAEVDLYVSSCDQNITIQPQVFAQFAISLGCIALMQQKEDKRPLLNFAAHFPKLSTQRKRQIVGQCIKAFVLYSAILMSLWGVNGLCLQKAARHLSQDYATTNFSFFDWRQLTHEAAMIKEKQQQSRMQQQRGESTIRQLLAMIRDPTFSHHHISLDHFLFQERTKNSAQSMHLSIHLSAHGETKEIAKNLKQKLQELKLKGSKVTPLQADHYKIELQIP